MKRNTKTLKKTFKIIASAWRGKDLETTSFTVQAVSRADAFMRASNRVTMSAVNNGLTDAQVFKINGRFI